MNHLHLVRGISQRGNARGVAAAAKRCGGAAQLGDHHRMLDHILTIKTMGIYGDIVDK